MKRLIGASAPLLLALTLVMGGCGKNPAPPTGNTSSGGNSSASNSGPVTTIDMNTADFTVHTATVAVGTPITFSDTVNGGNVHILCTGSGNGGAGSSACKTNSDAPKDFASPGTTWNAGDKKQETFSKAGTYHIICTIHPGMYIDITAK